MLDLFYLLQEGVLLLLQLLLLCLSLKLQTLCYKRLDLTNLPTINRSICQPNPIKAILKFPIFVFSHFSVLFFFTKYCAVHVSPVIDLCSYHFVV